MSDSDWLKTMKHPDVLLTTVTRDVNKNLGCKAKDLSFKDKDQDSMYFKVQGQGEDLSCNDQDKAKDFKE